MYISSRTTVGGKSKVVIHWLFKSSKETVESKNQCIKNENRGLRDYSVQNAKVSKQPFYSSAIVSVISFARSNDSSMAVSKSRRNFFQTWRHFRWCRSFWVVRWVEKERERETPDGANQAASAAVANVLDWTTIGSVLPENCWYRCQKSLAGCFKHCHNKKTYLSDMKMIKIWAHNVHSSFQWLCLSLSPPFTLSWPASLPSAGNRKENIIWDKTLFLMLYNNSVG